MNNTNMTRPEYPRPQWKRDAWINLNGAWEYQTDRGMSGDQQGYANGAPFAETIMVPFCRESKLSGLEHKDFCDAVWYRRAITVPADWRENGRRIIFHVGACDYHTEVYVNGKSTLLTLWR